MSTNSDKNQMERLRQQFSRNGNTDSGNEGGNPRRFNFYWIYGLLFVVFMANLLFAGMMKSQQPSNFTELSTMLEEGDVQRIDLINGDRVEVVIKPEALKSKPRYEKVRDRSVGEGLNPGPHFYFVFPAESFEKSLDRFYADHPLLKRSDVPLEFREERDYFSDVLTWVIPILLMVGLWLFIMRRISGANAGPGAQIFNIGKSRATLFDKDTNVKVTFKDVAGLEGAKEEIEEIVSFLKNPDKYTNLGGKIPKGALLVGPPGTGKTLLAKAVAGEAKVPFFSLSGSDFVEMFVGVGASRVRDLFKQAKDKSPAIIFIDEIDAIGRARGKNAFSGGNDERENTLNQLLTEMDGFNTKDHVIVLAATNRADILDRALMRAGRFDRLIYIDLPDLNERKEIFEVHLKPLKLGTDVDVDFLARQTPGFSGADIANVCNEAALTAARKDKKLIEKQDFLDSVDRIVGGLEKKGKIITNAEKEVIAYHEAGHATVSWMLEHAAPLVKVTIVPRGRSLGAAWYLPDERHLTNTEQMLDEMCATLGGRAAEDVVFGKISTGALSDLEKVTKQALAMVTVYGLNDKIGNITYYDSSGQNEYGFSKPYSEKTAQLIDEEIHHIVEAQYVRAKELLNRERSKLDQLAKLLLENEVIFKENLEEIFGKRPWLTREEAQLEEEARNASESVPT
ncbi:ATP-dependent zinc metalloprotease FtsH [bacterium]|nr:ATP-dependent zinc metalloprotease FtsH [bacterium]